MKERKSGDGKRVGLNVPLIAIVAVILVSTAFAGGLVYNKYFRGDPQYGGGRQISTVDSKGEDGKLPFDDPEALREALQKKVDESMLAIKINTNPVFQSPTSEGNLAIENSISNNYDIQVEITLDDSGEVVYTSPLLKPGQHKMDDKLSAKLEGGEYLATAMFYAYDDTEELMGQAGATVKLKIGE